MVFAGVGMVALPLDLLREFAGRPRATITHSEYMKGARGLGMRAKQIKVWSPPGWIPREPFLPLQQCQTPPPTKIATSMPRGPVHARQPSQDAMPRTPLLRLSEHALFLGTDLKGQRRPSCRCRDRVSLCSLSQDVTDTLRQDREGRGTRKWRTAFRRIQQQLLDLEIDSKALELVYPQVGCAAFLCCCDAQDCMHCTSAVQSRP
jgi:hypothetical protein